MPTGLAVLGFRNRSRLDMSHPTRPKRSCWQPRCCTTLARMNSFAWRYRIAIRPPCISRTARCILCHIIQRHGSIGAKPRINTAIRTKCTHRRASRTRIRNPGWFFPNRYPYIPVTILLSSFLFIQILPATPKRVAPDQMFVSPGPRPVPSVVNDAPPVAGTLDRAK